ncbi:MAG TPA: nitrilase-related carbon-nitrogen hydrolase, partial [Solimonas sp.]
MNATMAAIQMSSGDDVIANLETAAQLLREAASGGARLAVLPENFAFMGKHERDKLAVAEADGSGTIQERVAELARELDLWIIAGTLPIRVDGEARVHASCCVYDSDGARVARYDKIHLFDIDVPGGGERYRESASIAPGDLHPVVVDTPVGRVGLSVCYDVRFP